MTLIAHPNTPEATDARPLIESVHKFKTIAAEEDTNARPLSHTPAPQALGWSTRLLIS